MKRLTYKKIDLGLQVLLLAIWVIGELVITPIRNRKGIDYLFEKRFDFSYFFFGLAATQIISTITHFFFNKQIWKSKHRIIYYVLTGLSLLLLTIAILSDNLDTAITIGYILLIGTSALAIYYMVICGLEIKKWANSPEKI